MIIPFVRFCHCPAYDNNNAARPTLGKVIVLKATKSRVGDSRKINFELPNEALNSFYYRTGLFSILLETRAAMACLQNCLAVS